MNLLDSLDSLRERIALRFGHNKTEELCRLLYEIARREEKDPSALLDETLTQFSNDVSISQNVPFSKIKQTLLKRRYPSFSDEDLGRVFLAPLRVSKQSAEAEVLQSIFKPNQIFIEKAANHFPLAERVRNFWNDVPVIEIDHVSELKQPKKEWIKDFGKRTLAVSVENFDLIKPCPCSSSTVSCNYYLLNIGYGCPFDCSYCYLQDYQNLRAIVLPANVGQFLSQMDLVLKKNPNQFVRIGTGEFADSLALDWLTEYSKELIPFFADKNVILELKTKSDCVENLIGLKHGGKTVVAWSVTPKCFSKEEKGTAPLEKRLEAARICEEAGYGTAFHFDPIIDSANSERDYEELVESIFSHISKSVRWISMGTLRFHRDLRQVAEFRHPESDIFLGEGRLDPVDDKMRYPTERRIELYRNVLKAVRRFNPTVPVYLCMESGAVWKSVFEGKPYDGRIDEWISCGSTA